MILSAQQLFDSFSDRSRLTEPETKKLALALMQLRPETRSWKIRITGPMAPGQLSGINYREQLIILTRSLIANKQPGQIRDEILQQVAHACVGQFNFSSQWTELALQLGVRRSAITTTLLAVSQ